MTEGSVLLGYISGGWVRTEFFNSVLNAVCGPDADKAVAGVISTSAGPLVALARNLLATQFLSNDHEWLCSIDTDIMFATDTISRLLASADPIERPIMSALYYVFEKGKKSPAAYVNKGKGSKLDIVTFQDFEDNKFVNRVFGVGAGCLLVHRSVFETIDKDSGGDQGWFREGVIDGQSFGEDISFCVRAAISGFPVYVNPGVQVGHIKSAMLGEVT